MDHTPMLWYVGTLLGLLVSLPLLHVLVSSTVAMGVSLSGMVLVVSGFGAYAARTQR